MHPLSHRPQESLVRAMFVVARLSATRTSQRGAPELSLKGGQFVPPFGQGLPCRMWSVWQGSPGPAASR